MGSEMCIRDSFRLVNVFETAKVGMFDILHDFDFVFEIVVSASCTKTAFSESLDGHGLTAIGL